MSRNLVNSYDPPVRHCDHRLPVRDRLKRRGESVVGLTGLDRLVMCGTASRGRCPRCGAFICPACLFDHGVEKHAVSRT